jgi:hypothetical protein
MSTLRGLGVSLVDGDERRRTAVETEDDLDLLASVCKNVSLAVEHGITEDEREIAERCRVSISDYIAAKGL